MVGNLVIGGKGGVEDRPPREHVGDDGLDDEVADQHAHGRPDERILPSALAARSDVTPALEGCGEQLQPDLPDEQHDAQVGALVVFLSI